MPPPDKGSSLAGSLRIFRVAGISVYLHWSWLLVAYLVLHFRISSYGLWVWSVAEYLSLFAIVLVHEFGHALACRQVGGRADEIVLWPLGGIAFVDPPLRPGAVLWSIAAGPLVNVVLVPFTVGAFIAAGALGLEETNLDAYRFLFEIIRLNLVLLIFNMLPIYPLDGGQIVQALLWFVIGQAKSLLVVSVIGMAVAVAVIALAGLAVLSGATWSWWYIVLAVFAGLRCWVGFRQARLLARLESAPRHRDAACPSCNAHPLKGPFWKCDECHARFDTFTHQAECPACGKRSPTTACPECRRAHPLWAWYESDEQPAGEWEGRDPH
jgi:Zn-dependent protease